MRDEPHASELERETDPTVHLPSSLPLTLPPSVPAPSHPSSRKQYAMIGVAVTVIYVIGIGSLPFTLWSANAEGVPRADEWVYCCVIVYFVTVLILGPFFYGGMYSAFDPPIAPKVHFGWATTWKVRLPVGVTAVTVVSIATFLPPLALGESPRFFFMDSVVYILGFPILIVSGEIASRWSTGGKAPVRQSVRRLSQHALLLHDDEGEAVVSDVNDRSTTLRPSPSRLSLAPSLVLYVHTTLTQAATE